MQPLTFPLGPDYVKSWTTQRAIAELIANALDEDPTATATWADGVLTITDDGPGIPEEGMILGWSPKTDADIGQFGEGAKIASLVLARADDIGEVRCDTVRYGFTATVEEHRLLDGFAPRRSETAPQVLVYTFHRTTRTRGTQITIECPEQVATEAIGRFRHLTEPGYTPPVEETQILLTGPTGRLYIGGVLVSTDHRLAASYDFPLALAKTAQNRDRTVIDAAALTDLIRTALAGSTDPTVIGHFAARAVDGFHIAEPERYFSRVLDPRVKAAFRAVGRKRFTVEGVFYMRPGMSEAALDLLDGDYELLTTELDPGNHVALMELLGVKEAKVAATTRRDSVKKTKFVDLAKLTADERRTVESAVARVRALFGSTAVGTVKVYTETADRHLACADGFYRPADGSIALSRHILTDPARTLGTLLHEVAHRRAHRAGREFGDRTRGFENELTEMLGAVAARVDLSQVSQVVVAESQPPATRVALAGLLGDLVPAVCARNGWASAAELSAAVALHRNYLKMLLEPRPAGWRTPAGSMTPSTLSDFRKMEVLADVLGVRPGVLWLGHLLCEGPRFGRKDAQPKPGPWSGRISGTAELAAADLDAAGGVYAAAADQVRKLADGQLPSPGDSEEWQVFALEVIDAERVRLGLGAASTAAART